MSLQQICDLNAALDAVEGDRELLRRMVDVFVVQAPELLEEIRDAGARGDASTLERAAHKLRGSLCNFAAAESHDAALRLEELGRSGQVDGVAEVQAALEKAMAELQDALIEFSKGQARRILIADDEDATRLKLEALLSKHGYEVVVAKDGVEAWAILQREDAPTLAILDWMMPGLDGVEVCRNVRAAGNRPYTYIVMLTVRDETQDLVKGMDAGADDYLGKPFDVDELRVRLRAGERILRLQEELRLQATHDDLTGVLNRGTILEILQREAALVARKRVPVSIILADLDEFKLVNDTHGHAVGDAVLREASKRLGGRIRPYDSLGRYGGEEFLIVLPGCGAESALQVAERVRSCVADGPVSTRVGDVHLTVSLGVAAMERGVILNVDGLMHAADEALYRAKRSGRNRVEGPPKR